VVDAAAGLYAFDGRNWETICRVFGSVDRGTPAFYPSDAAGVPIDVVPVNPEDEIALLPTPYARNVATVVPMEPSPDALSRAGALPLNTAYTAQVQPEATDGEAAAPVTREGALPLSTAYTAQLQPGVTNGETAAPITRETEGTPDDSREASAQVSVEATELTVPPIASPQAAETSLPQVTAEFPAPTATMVPVEATATAEVTAPAAETAAPTEVPTETPTATAEATEPAPETPTAAPVEPEAPASNIGWWIGGTLALLALGGGGFMVYTKRKK
jgi:hypothetical protein